VKPPLIETGSKKQIPWATMLRDKVIESLPETLARFSGAEIGELNSTAAHQAFMDILADRIDAHYWIDNRDISTETLIREWWYSQYLTEPAHTHF
jgi:hypothetical protein